MNIEITTVDGTQPIEDALLNLPMVEIANERDALYVKEGCTTKLGGASGTIVTALRDESLMELAAKICAVGRLSEVRRVSCIAETEHELEILDSLTALVPKGNSRFTVEKSKDGFLSFVTPDNTPQPHPSAADTLPQATAGAVLNPEVAGKVT